MRDIVKITEPGGRILDPFAGSGTTVLEGYSATGIEVTATYTEKARERINKQIPGKSPAQSMESFSVKRVPGNPGFFLVGLEHIP